MLLRHRLSEGRGPGRQIGGIPKYGPMGDRSREGEYERIFFRPNPKSRLSASHDGKMLRTGKAGLTLCPFSLNHYTPLQGRETNTILTCHRTHRLAATDSSNHLTPPLFNRVFLFIISPSSNSFRYDTDLEVLALQ